MSVTVFELRELMVSMYLPSYTTITYYVTPTQFVLFFIIPGLGYI